MPIKHIAEGPIEAAGVLFVCPNTKKMLLIYRSADVVDPSCWCGAGGKIEEGETEQEAAIRECEEEIGFDSSTLKAIGELYVHKSDSLTFTNFLGIVDEEFTPVLNWESAGYVWCGINEIPEPKHYGLSEMLTDTKARMLIEKAIGIGGEGT